MKFTILGASGFIGSHLVRHLIADGHDCFAPARGDPAVFDRDLGHVIYAIGLTADFRTRPFDTVRAHVCLLADILEGARFESLLYLSSTRVYQGAEDTREDAPLTVNPNVAGDLYNLTKLTGESLCLSCGRANVRVARLSNVVGNDPGAETFFGQILRQIKDREQRIELQTTPDSEKDYIGIDDVVEILSTIAIRGQQQMYNVASGRNLRNSELMDAIRQAAGIGVSISPGALTIKFPSILIDRLRNEFDFSPLPMVSRLKAWIAEYSLIDRRVF